MFKINKKFPLVVSGLLCSSLITACGEFEALTPNADITVLEKNVCEQVTATDERSYLSESLSGALLQSLIASSDVVFGEQAKTLECPEKAYMESFDNAGRGKVLGVSVSRLQSEVSGMAQIDVKVYSRAASINREMQFIGQLANQDSGNALVELNKASAGENLDAYLACLGLDSKMETALRQNEAFNIRAFASCQDANCEQVLVQLELDNMKSRILNSRVALMFKKDGASITNGDGSVEMSLVESSLESVGTFAEAELNKKEEVIAPECMASLEKRQETSANHAETVSAPLAPVADETQSQDSAQAQSSVSFEETAGMNVDASVVEAETVELNLTNVNEVSEEQNAVMQQAIEQAIQEANEDSGYKVGPQ